jgi:hypothetical protein
MSKRRIHFLGFLANVDDSILKLNLRGDFRTEKESQNGVKPFMQKTGFFRGADGQFDVLSSGSCYCVVKDDVDEFDSTPQGGVIAKWGRLEQIHTPLNNKVKLLRLYKEGDILLCVSFLYFGNRTEPGIFQIIWESPLGISRSMSIFSMRQNEVSEVQKLIDTVKIPFHYKFLQLAFDSFNLSYEIHNLNLIFLSLMISLESMFNLNRSEVAFQVSRNCAVLLGRDKEDSEQIFKDIKSLYGKRSNIIHGSKDKVIAKEDIMNLRQYVRQSIKEINFIGVDRKELLNTLNSCGFGQRPWRN